MCKGPILGHKGNNGSKWNQHGRLHVFTTHNAKCIWGDSTKIRFLRLVKIGRPVLLQNRQHREHCLGSKEKMLVLLKQASQKGEVITLKV